MGMDTFKVIVGRISDVKFIEKSLSIKQEAAAIKDTSKQIGDQTIQINKNLDKIK